MRVTAMKLDPARYRVEPGKKVRLGKLPTRVKPSYESKAGYKRALGKQIAELSALQGRLYADNRYALLLIFQAMDAAGKDGVIKHVMSGVNPQGCQVFSFNHPSAAELDHDFLWRSTHVLPERGRIGIFNRSYYEEVLIVRVHPEILRAQNLPRETVRGDDLWQQRYQSIAASSGTCTATAPGSSSSSSTCRRKSSASAFSSASTIRTRTGNSAAPTSTSAGTGSSTRRHTRRVSARPARGTHPGMSCPPTTSTMRG